MYLTPGKWDVCVGEVSRICPGEFLWGTEGPEAECGGLLGVRGYAEGMPWPRPTGALGRVDHGLGRKAGPWGQEMQNDSDEALEPQRQGSLSLAPSSQALLLTTGLQSSQEPFREPPSQGSNPFGKKKQGTFLETIFPALTLFSPRLCVHQAWAGGLM